MEDPERERIAMNGDAERSGSPYSSFEVNGGLNGRDDDKHPINVSPGRERERELDVDADLELIEGEFNDVIHVHVPEDASGWRKLLAYLGPGFLVAIAYIDPANFETDLQAGAQYKYSLLWVLLVASIGGLLIQSLCANLGIVTGKHLAEHCRIEYPWGMRIALWVIAEIEIIASDIPEVIGSAFALNMLFGLRLWVGVIFTGFSTIMLLAIQKYGIRWLEMFIASLVMVIAVCFFLEMGHTQVEWLGVVEGLLFPWLENTGATALAISIVGAVVMPHNLFLHSALVLSRKQARTQKAITDGCRYCLVEVSIALLVAFAINVAVICVGGAVCSSPKDAKQEAECADINLNTAYILLQNTLGSWASTVFGIALLASGQSSTVTGTYAGQYVMAGFLDLRMKTWLRNLLTRLVAIVPSLAVSILGGSKGAAQLIIISSMVLSFGLPYALIPLLKFTSDPLKMGPYVNSPLVTSVTWVVGILVIMVNCFFVVDVFSNIVSKMHISSIAFFLFALLALVLVAAYVTSLVLLAIRPDTEQTYFDGVDLEDDLVEKPMSNGLEGDGEGEGEGVSLLTAKASQNSAKEPDVL